MSVLGKKNRAEALTRKQALGCIPIKNSEVSEERSPEGDLILVYPVRVRPAFAALGRFLGRKEGKPPKKRLQLDQLGSAAWELFDGTRAVRGVVEKFAEKFDLHPREAEVSVTAFIRELGKRGLLGIKQ